MRFRIYEVRDTAYIDVVTHLSPVSTFVLVQFGFIKGPVGPRKCVNKRRLVHYTKAATTAPIPPAIIAAACVGIVAARFDDADELGLLPDALLDDPEPLALLPP